MSRVRLLVGTRKGAFVLTSDGKRDSWTVDGPHFPGWEMYHLKGSPVDPDRIYASQSNGWFGQLLQRSDDGGKTWTAVSNDFAYQGDVGTHMWYDGSSRPWEFTRIWHLEPSPDDPATVYAGAQDAALFRSTDAGQTWSEMAGLRHHSTGLGLATGRRRPVPAHDPPSPRCPGLDGGGHFRRRRVPQRRWRRKLAPSQQWPAFGGRDPRP